MSLPPDVAIRIEGLRKRFGSLVVLDGVSLDLYRVGCDADDDGSSNLLEYGAGTDRSEIGCVSPRT